MDNNVIIDHGLGSKEGNSASHIWDFITPEGLTEKLAALRDTSPVIPLEAPSLTDLYGNLPCTCVNKKQHLNGKTQPLNAC